MHILEQVEKLLPALTPGEKARLLQTLVRDLGEAFAWIDSQPGICGGDPCIVRTRIPVWALEYARRRGISESQLLHSYPTLKAEDLTNSWAYVRAHAAEIDAQIAQNEAAWQVVRAFADENFPLPVVEALRRLGHDVFTL